MSNELQARLLAEYNERFESDSESDDLNSDHSLQVSLNIVFIRGFRNNSKIVYDGEYLYYQNAFNKYHGVTACTCYEKECTARIFVRKDETAYKLRTMQHSKTHGNMHDIFKHMHCFNLMKDKCLTAPASIPVREIYNDVVLE